MIPIYRYTEKKRDSNNAIKQYILEDIHTHQTYTVNKDELKTKMTSNQVRVTNLQIDSQGRLVDKQETISSQHPNLQSQSRNPASMSPTVRTDAGVLERRQAQRRWSGREQDGVASEHNGALPQRGRFGSSITPNLCVLCYPL